MRCNFNKLIAYLNDDLDKNQNHDVVVHLHECNICLEAVSTMLQDQGIEGQFQNVSIYEGESLQRHAVR